MVLSCCIGYYIGYYHVLPYHSWPPAAATSYDMLRLSEAKDLEPSAIRQAIERAVVESPGWVLWGSA